jgi:hypothetical protein
MAGKGVVEHAVERPPPSTLQGRRRQGLGRKASTEHASRRAMHRRAVGGVMWHGVDVISPSSWEPQEEGMMSTVANFPSVRNQGLSYPGKSQTPEGDAC